MDFGAVVAQCELARESCGQNRYQRQTCEHWHAQCLQTLKNDRHEYFVVGVGCGIFAFICFLVDWLAQYNDYMVLAVFGAIQLYRAYPWGEQDSILGIEVLILACRLFWGKRSRFAPFAQWCFVCLMLFGNKYGFNYFMRQIWSHKVEVGFGLACLGYDVFKNLFRPAPVQITPAPVQITPAPVQITPAPKKTTDVIVKSFLKLLRETEKENRKLGKSRCRSPAHP